MAADARRLWSDLGLVANRFRFAIHQPECGLIQLTDIILSVIRVKSQPEASLPHVGWCIRTCAWYLGLKSLPRDSKCPRAPSFTPWPLYLHPTAPISLILAMLARRTASFLSLLALVSSVLAGVHEIWWNITWVENANPDGLHPRRVIGVNGTWPYVFSLFNYFVICKGSNIPSICWYFGFYYFFDNSVIGSKLIFPVF